MSKTWNGILTVSVINIMITRTGLTVMFTVVTGSNVPVVSLEGLCPAEVIYSNCSSKDYFYSALRLVLEIHRTKEEGDVVLFLASAQVRQFTQFNSDDGAVFVRNSITCLFLVVLCSE